jgi:uncharacterized membrane protein
MTSDDSIYRAPSSSLGRPSEGDARSLDDAIAGEFDFKMGEVLSEAWALTDGSKSVLLGGLAISIGVSGANAVVTSLAEMSDSSFLSFVAFVVYLVATAVSYSINGGMTLYAIKRAAADPSASFDDILSCFGMILPIFGIFLLYILITMFGFVLLVLPGIYVAVGYMLAVPLKVERGTGIWESLETSRKAIHNVWLRVAGLMLATTLAVVIGGLVTFGIGLIWLIPFASLVVGVMYREIFGYTGNNA